SASSGCAATTSATLLSVSGAVTGTSLACSVSKLELMVQVSDRATLPVASRDRPKMRDVNVSLAEAYCEDEPVEDSGDAYGASARSSSSVMSTRTTPWRISTTSTM